MSKLNDLDNDLFVVPEKTKIVDIWRRKTISHANACKVERLLLERLVCYAYYGGQITEGNAMKTLGLERRQFRELYQEEYQKTFELEDLL